MSAQISKDQFDILITGAGPAGTCIALRLLKMGYRVAMVERQSFPRQQIGESMSPGVKGIFAFLEAEPLLCNADYLVHLPARVIWESTGPVINPDADHIMVNRGVLDSGLLTLAVSRGLYLFQPAAVTGKNRRGDGTWDVKISTEQQTIKVNARFIVDARGRRGTSHAERINYAPANLAIWTDLDLKDNVAAAIGRQTIVEAVEEGWLWAAPLPAGQFRVMVFTAPSQVKQQSLRRIFYKLLGQSSMLNKIKEMTSLSGLQSCMVHQYIHQSPWEDNVVRVGEAAFSIDPLSSSGVEKAMRFSLQAAIAINSALQGQAELAKTYFEKSLIAAVAAHSRWTAGFYKSAWPAAEGGLFWQERSVLAGADVGRDDRFGVRFVRGLANAALHETFHAPVHSSETELIRSLWNRKMSFAAELKFVQQICVVGDQLELKDAIAHPNLPTAVAFINEVEIMPLIAGVAEENLFSEIVYGWCSVISFNKAVSVALHLFNYKILYIS